MANSIDADGMRQGYELTLTRWIAEAVRIPVIASGGGGAPEHLYQVLSEGRADAALVASMLHYGTCTGTGNQGTPGQTWREGEANMELKYDHQGLIPAIVQDAGTGQVLMLAYMNAEALAKTLESGETWFWSRSRQTLWHKGATSGNVQPVDRDTLRL